MKHYDDLVDRLRTATATKLPLLQALMNEAADAIETLAGAEKRKTEKDALLTDYISREAALESVREKVLICESLPDTIAKDASLFTLASMNDSLNSIPAADVRPVVRGKWVKARGSWCTPGGDPVWECSVCGKGRHVYGIEHGSYGADVADGQWVACPNCGAYMGEPPEEET